VYFDDLYGQIFSLFILTVAAAESSLGIAITILYYRIRGTISLEQIPSLRY
jgi:NADH-quinone oxidoreductase subunit K